MPHKRNPRTTSCNVALECEHLSCFVRVVSEPSSNFHLRQRQICIHHNNRVISFFLIFRLQIKLLLVRSWLQVSRLPFIPFHFYIVSNGINSIECHKVLVHVLLCLCHYFALCVATACLFNNQISSNATDLPGKTFTVEITASGIQMIHRSMSLHDVFLHQAAWIPVWYRLYLVDVEH